MANYFDPLADVLPQIVLDAMHKACTDATWHDKGRPGEPTVMAGIRALIDHTVLKSEHDQQVQHHVNFQRSEAEHHARRLQQRVVEVRNELRLDLHRLDAVRQLADTNRKTVRVDELRQALGRSDCGTVTVELPVFEECGANALQP